MTINSFFKSYSPIPQLPYCCVPAILQWILYRHGFPIDNQEEIGIELGLRLPERVKNGFNNPHIAYLIDEPRDGWGTQIEKKKYSINNYFYSHKLPFTCSEQSTFHSVSKIKTFIESNFRKDNDIIIRYLKQHPVRPSEYNGHFSLISALNKNENMITVGDPAGPIFWKCYLEEIIDLMSNKHDSVQRGLYIISKNK
jgi:hypothetical protein